MSTQQGKKPVLDTAAFDQSYGSVSPEAKYKDLLGKVILVKYNDKGLHQSRIFPGTALLIIEANANDICTLNITDPGPAQLFGQIIEEKSGPLGELLRSSNLSNKPVHYGGGVKENRFFLLTDHRGVQNIPGIPAATLGRFGLFSDFSALQSIYNDNPEINHKIFRGLSVFSSSLIETMLRHDSSSLVHIPENMAFADPRIIKDNISKIAPVESELVFDTGFPVHPESVPVQKPVLH